MKCPFCGSEQVFVSNSRPTKNNTEVWRRRRCGKCESDFSTHEKIDLSYIVLVKKDGRRVRYSKVKMYSGIYHAIVFGKKVDRGSSAEMAQEIADMVEQTLVLKKTKEITTSDLSNLIMEILAEKNPGAFLRYAAYFKNPKSYREIKRIIGI